MTFYGQSESTGSELKHPTTIWTKWNGKDGVFKGRDREKQAEVELKLPEEFIVVAEGMGVDGYIDGAVTSNEFFSKNDYVKVRNWRDRRTMYSGKWDDIKDKVKATGLQVWKHLHVIFPGEEGIKTLKIKGTSWVAWSDFNTINAWAPANNRIKITGTIKGKKGATTFVTPKFELGTPLTAEDKELQKKYCADVLGYYQATKITEAEANAEKKDIDNTENLPF